MSPAIRLGAIAFINTLPIYWRLRAIGALEEIRTETGLAIDLIDAVPSRLNALMAAGQLDISPVSSAAYLRHQDDWVLLDDLSVSSPGAVESVIFVSNRPWGQALLEHEAIRIPDDSETSVALLAHLLQQATGQDVRDRFQVFPANQAEQALRESGNALIIGDNALLTQEKGFPAGYKSHDLSSLWKGLTGLPFVFAVWVANKVWADKNLQSIQTVNAILRQCRDDFYADPNRLESSPTATVLAMAERQSHLPKSVLKRYYGQCLSYGLDSQHRKALNLFGKILNTLDTQNVQPIPNPSTGRDAIPV